MNLEYDWGRETVTEPGFYIALKENRLSKKLNPVVVCCKQDSDGEVGWHGYTGPEEHCSSGNPHVRAMRDDFIVWARLPDPL